MKLFTLHIAVLVLLSCNNADSTKAAEHKKSINTELSPRPGNEFQYAKTDSIIAPDALRAAINPTSNPSKYALIIANTDYNDGTGWADLASKNDIVLLSDAMAKKGFETENIMVVEDADDSAIDQAFSDFTKIVTEGSAVIVHYSGHGQQIFDDNDDEIDGYDEAIVPVNAHVKFEDGKYEGEHHIRDESIGDYLAEIRSKIGPDGQVLAVLDACHSGTGTRGNTRHRGSSEALQPDGYKPKKEADKEFGLQSIQENLAPLVCLYGASPDELNYEYEASPGFHVGSLSFAFSKALAEADTETTYRTLFDQIKVTMSSIAPAQTPMSEGLSDQVLLGGDILNPIEYYSVTDATKKNEKMYVSINGGRLSGLYPGSKINFYQVGTYDISKAEPIATGAIIDSDALASQIELEKTVSKKDINGTWAMVTQRNYGDLKIRVQIDIDDADLEESLSSKLSEFQLIELSDESPELFIEQAQSRGNEIGIYGKTNDALWIKKNYAGEADELSQEIMGAITAHSQIRFLRRLEMDDPSLRTTFEVQPIEVVERRDGSVEKVVSTQPLETKIDDAGNLVLKDGDWIQIKIKNEGKKQVYFTLVDIMPDNTLNVLLPESDNKAADYALSPGQELVSPPMNIGPPYGRDVFKLIATEEPIELGRIINTRGKAATRGSSSEPTNPLEMLFSDSYKANKEATTRGARTVSVPAGSAHIESLIYLIQE